MIKSEFSESEDAEHSSDYPKGLLKDTASHIASRCAALSLTDRDFPFLNL